MRKYTLKETGYHPAGAEFDPNAPYNQKNKIQDFVVSITISKCFSVKCPEGLGENELLNYIPEAENIIDNLENNNWCVDEYTIVNDD